jgi:hypothetical protein
MLKKEYSYTSWPSWPVLGWTLLYLIQLQAYLFAGQAFNQITNAYIHFTMHYCVLNMESGLSHGAHNQQIIRIISFCSSEIYTTKHRAQRDDGRGLPNITHFFYNTVHSSLAYIINEMEYQLVQSICQWVTAFVLYSFLTSPNLSGILRHVQAPTAFWVIRRLK